MCFAARPEVGKQAELSALSDEIVLQKCVELYFNNTGPIHN
jgi:hypothetical protein